MSSRASRISDVLTARDINEIADTEAGAVQSAVILAVRPKDDGEGLSQRPANVPTGIRVAEVSQDGKVNFGEATKPSQ